MTNRQNRRIRIEDAIHRSTPEQLLIGAILQPAATRNLIDRELDRRAHGEVPQAVCGRIDPQQSGWLAAA